MNNTIQYKGYVGSVEFSEEDGIFYGKVMGIRSLTWGVYIWQKGYSPLAYCVNPTWYAGELF